jgi:tetratricopeptide (TPR) repeat protein
LVLWGVLLLVTGAAYAPAWHGGPLWDDDAHLTRDSLQSLDGLRRIWFDVGATQQYYPVVHSAFWVFHWLWGEHTLGYHLGNIVLHATSALLFAVILRRLAVPGAVLAAFIFAVHPVHVESVAWMTELKNTLSGVFYLAAGLMLLRFDRTRQRRPWIAALLLFVLALLSKSVTATLPAAVLVVLWWDRGRLRWRDDVVPLLPFFVLGVGAGLFTAWVERAHIGAAGAAFDFTLVERTLIAGRAIWFYLGTLLWPVDLIFVYPRWEVSQAVWWQYLYPAGVLALVAGLWWWRTRSRAPLAAMLFFAGTLFPALGFFNVYPFIFSFVADHFQYLASLGIIALFSAGLTMAARRAHIPARYAGAALVVVAAALTWQQSKEYADPATLYRTTLSRNPDAWMAHVNLGWLSLQSSADASVHRAQLEEAVAHFNAALRLKPDVPQAHNNLGTAFMRLGRLDEAHAAYQQGLRLTPDDAEVRYNLSLLLERMGRSDEAVLHAREAIRLEPDHAAAHTSLGNALQTLGRFEDAVAAYREAIRLDSDDAMTRLNLGSALGRLGRSEEAAVELEAALRLDPRSLEARRNLGIALLRSGRMDEGLARFREAASMAPSASTYLDLGHALESVGRYDAAIAALREAVRLDPSRDDARASLDRVLRIRQ